MTRESGIHLGFEVGSGDPVSIPIRHLAVTGQTQESGKTTTLEALVARSGVTALAFITKRGESAFSTLLQASLPPYFRDRADWQFVTSIIDATLQEKNKFLRPWIMKICRTTRTLAEVQLKVREALRSAKGIHEGVYTQLEAYLELIVPEIGRTQLAPDLVLQPDALNVMDLSRYSSPMQMLFVQSALDWVNEHASKTVVIVPEAWEFIPEGKSSPVKASAVNLVRKGAGLGNYIWVDSQDMAGVDKVILRGCPVWLIGVQREANEIKRNLANIPQNIKKPTAGAVATLQRGEFFACWGQHAIKVYVQPAWMPAEEAQGRARTGNRGGARPPSAPTRGEATVNESEARELREENAQLKARVQQLETLTRTYVENRIREGPVGNAVPRISPATPPDTDALYQAIKARLVADAPGLVRVLANKAELEIQVTRQTVTVDGTSWLGRVAGLLAEGFFDTPKKSGAVFKEVTRRGGTGVGARADEACKKLLAMGFVSREDEGYLGVQGMKVNVVER